MVIPEIDPPKALLASIFGHISLHKRRTARLRVVSFGATTLAFTALLVPAVEYTLHELYISGFSEYASLFLESLGTGTLKEVVYSLVSSFPSLPVLALVCVLGLVWWSVRQVRENWHPALSRFAHA